MKRPVAVTIIGWLFIAAGTVGFLYHISELNFQNPFDDDGAWVLMVRLLAIAGGILTLRGINFGRWLVVTWMAYHVVLSFFHPLSELIMHAVLLLAIMFALFHSRVAVFFKNAKRQF